MQNSSNIDLFFEGNFSFLSSNFKGKQDFLEFFYANIKDLVSHYLKDDKESDANQFLISLLKEHDALEEKFDEDYFIIEEAFYSENYRLFALWLEELKEDIREKIINNVWLTLSKQRNSYFEFHLLVKKNWRYLGNWRTLVQNLMLNQNYPAFRFVMDFREMMDGEAILFLFLFGSNEPLATHLPPHEGFQNYFIEKSREMFKALFRK